MWSLVGKDLIRLADLICTTSGPSPHKRYMLHQFFWLRVTLCLLVRFYFHVLQYHMYGKLPQFHDTAVPLRYCALCSTWNCTVCCIWYSICQNRSTPGITSSKTLVEIMHRLRDKHVHTTHTISLFTTSASATPHFWMVNERSHYAVRLCDVMLS